MVTYGDCKGMVAMVTALVQSSYYSALSTAALISQQLITCALVSWSNDGATKVK